MSTEENLLDRYLLFYQLVDAGLGTATLRVQIYPGYSDTTSAICLVHILMRHQFEKMKRYHFLWKKPLLSLSVEESDIIFMYITENDFASAGGIWQIQWRNDDPKGYHFVEITASGLEMIEVKQLLQEEDFALFEEALTHAKAFFQTPEGAYPPALVSGREVGAFAPDSIYQVTPSAFERRAVEHTWYIILRRNKDDMPGLIFSLMEVVYHLQDREWQFSVKVLEERDDFPEFTLQELILT